jgi:hypothetical protein
MLRPGLVQKLEASARILAEPHFSADRKKFCPLFRIEVPLWVVPDCVFSLGVMHLEEKGQKKRGLEFHHGEMVAPCSGWVKGDLILPYL